MATTTALSSTRVSSNVAPLTTTFTPPPPCFSHLTQYYWVVSNTLSQNPDGGPSTSETVPGWFSLSTWYSGGPEGGVATSTCYPSSFASIDYFSPGICPSGYTPGCVSTTALSGSSNTETRAICCPSNWFCDTAATSFIGDVGYLRQWIASYPCAYFPSGVVTVRSAFTELGSASGIEVNAKGVSIRWQNTDFVSSSTSSVSAVTTSAPAQTPSSRGLSDGAKAGIGVGVAAVVSIFFAALVFWVVMKRRVKKGVEEDAKEEDTTGNDDFEEPEFDAATARLKAELGDFDEKPDSKELGESGPIASEVEAPGRAELAGNKPAVHEAG